MKTLKSCGKTHSWCNVCCPEMRSRRRIWNKGLDLGGLSKQEHARKYRAGHKEQARLRSQRYARKNPEKIALAQRTWLQQLRKAALNAYGGICVCCGERTIQFLAIDHIEGDGTQHRKDIHSNFYKWLKDNNYPPGFRVLCHNCNCARGFYGFCPHNA